jgi:hypothetical protein
MINKYSLVLFENKITEENKYFGRDEHFNSVIVSSKSDLTGKIKIVKIIKNNKNTLLGEVKSNTDHKNYAA